MCSSGTENVIFILVGTKHPGNLGSVARAMGNMGIEHLRLVSPKCSANEESRRLAKAGTGILDTARTFRTLGGAVRDLRYLIGTTGKTGGNRAQTYSPRALAGSIVGLTANQKVGVLFGPEDTGLVDDDLLRCQKLIRIPTSPHARSLNLSHAVMLVAYELYLAQLATEPARVPKLATLPQVEAMFAQLEGALLEIGFLQEQNARHMMFALRRILGRAGLEQADVDILRGIARQIAWYSAQRKASDADC
jgi:tRNA/rRNA methyltransferase